MHCPEQLKSPLWHAHAPSTQLVPAGQALPQLPQLALLWRRSTHPVEHAVEPAGHPVAPPAPGLLPGFPPEIRAVPQLASRLTK